MADLIQKHLASVRVDNRSFGTFAQWAGRIPREGAAGVNNFVRNSHRARVVFCCSNFLKSNTFLVDSLSVTSQSRTVLPDSPARATLWPWRQNPRLFSHAEFFEVSVSQPAIINLVFHHCVDEHKVRRTRAICAHQQWESTNGPSWGVGLRCVSVRCECYGASVRGEVWRQSNSVSYSVQCKYTVHAPLALIDLFHNYLQQC